MTRQLGTVAADADLHEVIATMNQGGFRRLAVSDGEGCIVGVLSVGLWDPHAPSRHPGCRAPK